MSECFLQVQGFRGFDWVKGCSVFSFEGFKVFLEVRVSGFRHAGFVELVQKAYFGLLKL